MIRKPISRRTLLRGAFNAAVSLPLLDVMARPARALAQKKRFVVFFTPNGTIPEAWRPTGTETGFKLSRILEPLEPHRSKILVLAGIDNKAAMNGPGSDHSRGMGTMLTGRELLPGNFSGGGNQTSGLASGISVDQEIAKAIGNGTRFRSLELGVLIGYIGNPQSYTSYLGANRAVPAENNPAAVYQRLFSGPVTTGGSPDAAGLMRLVQDRKSVLDAVRDDIQALKPRLGQDDRARVDGYFTSIREIEAGLLSPVSGGGCRKPAAPVIDHKSNANGPAIAKLQTELLVAALACDQTRVATLQFDKAAGQIRYTWLGVTRGHHDVSHDPNSKTASREALIKINQWFAQQYGNLIEALGRVSEDGRTLLDSTVVFWCNELERGNSHSHPNMPYVLAGGGGGLIRPGRFLTYNRPPHNDLLVSLLNVYGVNTRTFGDPRYCTGPLPGLT